MTGVDSSRKPRAYIYTHTALRGIAAFCVVAYHLQFGAPHYLTIESATLFFKRGYLLVDLFFILSGFIISYTAESSGIASMRKRDIYRFYVIRFARIYPLHLFCLFAILFLTVIMSYLQSLRHSSVETIGIESSAALSFVEELFLIQAWIPGAPRWNIPSWSISAELFAYFVFPVIVLFRRHVPRLATCILLVFPVIFYFAVQRGAGSLDVITGLAPLRCLAGFAIGMVLCDSRRFSALWPNYVIAISQFVAIAAIVIVLATPSPDPEIIPAFALLVFVTWQDRGPLRSLLPHRIFLRSGELSYSIYLTHVGIIAIVFPLWYGLARHMSLNPDLGRALFIVACFTLIIVVSQWTYANVEQRGRRFVLGLLLEEQS